VVTSVSVSHLPALNSAARASSAPARARARRARLGEVLQVGVVAGRGRVGELGQDRGVEHPPQAVLVGQAGVGQRDQVGGRRVRVQDPAAARWRRTTSAWSGRAGRVDRGEVLVAELHGAQREVLVADRVAGVLDVDGQLPATSVIVASRASASARARRGRIRRRGHHGGQPDVLAGGLGDRAARFSAAASAASSRAASAVWSRFFGGVCG
jgi:hypothetical protein